MNNVANLPARPSAPSKPWLPSLRAEWVTVGNAKAKVWVIPTALTPAQRLEISAYHDEVAASLTVRPADEEAKAKAIAKLYAVLASERVPDEYLQIRMETWLDDLSRRPAWEIGEAAAMWRRGDFRADGENRSFVPKPAELLRLADIARRGREAEAMMLGNLLAAIPEKRLPPSEPVARLPMPPDNGVRPIGSAARETKLAIDRLEDRCREAGVDIRSLPNRPPGREMAQVADALPDMQIPADVERDMSHR